MNMISYKFIFFFIFFEIVGFSTRSKIYIAGHTGLIGSSLTKLLREKNYTNLVLKTSTELDLRKQDDVEAFFREESPEYVFLLAARAGGVGVNLYYPDLLYDNIMILTLLFVLQIIYMALEILLLQINLM